MAVSSDFLRSTLPDAPESSAPAPGASVDFLKSALPEPSVAPPMLAPSEQHNIRRAAQTNPSEVEDIPALAKALDLPPALVMLNPKKYRERAKEQNIRQAAKQSPGFQQLMSDPLLAKLAADDYENLTLLERALVGRTTAEPIRGPKPTPGNIASSLAGELFAGFEAVHRGLQLQIADLVGDPATREQFARAGRGVTEAQAETPAFESHTASGIYSGAASFLRQLPGLAASVALRNPAPGLGLIGLQTYGDAYIKYRDRDATPDEAALGASLEAFVEVATELPGMGYLAGNLGKKGFKEFLFGLLKREIPGEQVATLAQDAIDTAIANPEKTWADYWRERLGAQYETLVATITQGGITGALNRVGTAIEDRQRQGVAAQEHARVIESMMNIAAGSQLRARSAEAFQQYVKNTAGGNDSVYVDGAMFMQALDAAGEAGQRAVDAMPTVAEQLIEAGATNGLIRIPIDELLTAAPGSGLDSALLPHIRRDEHAPSAQEAETFFQREAEEIQRMAEEAMSRTEADVAFSDSAFRVEQQVMEQLQATGRFTDDVNRVYATIAKSLFTTMAEREGLLPEELFARYFGGVTASDLTGEGLDQYGGARTMQDAAARRALPIAERMEAEGKDSEDIRISTGWFRNPYDGKWRYEFSDHQAELAPAQPENDIGLSDDASSRTALDALPESKIFGDIESIPLDRVVNHQGLFERYPEARGISVVKRRGLFDFGGLQGWFNPEKNEIGVTPYATDPLNTILHEVQHWIQDKEGFARGGNANVVFDALTQAQKERVAKLALDSIQKQFEEMRDARALAERLIANYFSEITEIRALQQDNKNRREAGESVKDRADLLNKLNAIEAAIKRDMGFDFLEATPGEQRAWIDVINFPKDLNGIVPKYEKEILDLAQSSALIKSGDSDALKKVLKKTGDDHKLYRAIAGEIEARDVQARQNLTPEERAERPPLSAEVFDPEDVIVVADDVLTAAEQFAENQGVLAQGNRGGFSPSTNTISLLNNADLSTFLHELGHLWLEMQADIAAQPNASARSKADTQILLDWFGVKDLDTWRAMTLDEKRPHHEQLTYNLEIYFFEGKAPTEELRGVFARIRTFMLGVYKNIVDQLNAVYEREFGKPLIQLTPEVREVFDRMLATEEAIRQTEQDLEVVALFEQRADFPGTDEAWAEYQELAREAHTSAVENLQARSLRDLKWVTNLRLRTLKEFEKDAKEKTAAVREEVEAELRDSPTYAAFFFLRSGELGEGALAGQPQETRRVITEAGSTRLDIDTLRALYGDAETEAWRRLPTGRGGLVGKDGLDPNLVAQLFGFRNGDQLIHALDTAPPFAEAVEVETNRRVFQRYGDLSSPEAIQEAANEAVANAARERMVATEIRTLEEGTGERSRPVQRILQRLVRDSLAKKRVADINANAHEAQALRSGREARQARKAGDLPAALVAMRQKLWHRVAAKEARKAQDEVARGLRFLRKFGKRNKALPLDYQEKIWAILDRVDLRRLSEGEITRRESFTEWADRIEQETGQRPIIDSALVESAERVPYQRMPLEQFRALVEMVKNIDHTGRFKQKLLNKRAKAELDATVKVLTESADANAPKTRTASRENARWSRRAANFLDMGFAWHRKFAAMLRELDGFGDAGLWYETIGRGMNEAADNEIARMMKVGRQLEALFKPLMARTNFLEFTRPKLVPGARDANGREVSLSYQARLMVALNHGNEVNYQRMRDGEGFTDATMRAVLDSLSKEDMDFVQGVWDHLESYKAELAELEREITGTEPTWVEPAPVETKHGVYRGGYMPIAYDALRDPQAKQFENMTDMQALYRGSRGRQSTLDGFLKNRSGQAIARPQRLDFGVIFTHISQVNHRLAWERWLYDTKRIMNHADVKTAFAQHLGVPAYNEAQRLLTEVALGRSPTLGLWGDKFAEALSNNVSIAYMGWKMTTAAIQVVGFNQSVVRLGGSKGGGYKWLAAGLRDIYFGNVRENIRMALDKSDFLRGRAMNLNQSVREISQRLTMPSKFAAVQKTFFWPMVLMQMGVDLPTWAGAYNKAVASKTEGGLGLDEASARAFADQVVRDAQGSGAVSDLSGAQRGGGWQAMFTRFYNYMNTTLQLNVEAIRRRKDGPMDYFHAIHDLMLTNLMPAVLTTVITNAVTDSGEDEDWKEEILRELGAYMLGQFMFLRELSGLVNQYDYRGPSALRVVGEIGKVGSKTIDLEFDRQFWKAFTNVIGLTTGAIPAAQINATVDGVRALYFGETDNPLAPVFGPPRN